MDAAAAGRERTAYVLLTLAALSGGGAFVAGRLAVEAIPPLAIAATRFAIASVLLWGWSRTKRSPAGALSPRDLPVILGMGLTAVAAYNVLFLNGLRLAPASDGAIIAPGLTPVLTALLAWAVLGEGIGRSGAIGLAAALAGLILVVNPAGPHAPGRLLGDLFFFLGAGCWAIYSLVGKVATERYGSVTATLYAAVAGWLALVPFALAEGGWTALASAPPRAWLGVLYLAIFGTVVNYVFFYEGISRLGAVRASAFVLLVPVFGVMLTMLLLGERLTAPTFLGGLLVLLGLWLVQRRGAV